MWRDVVAFLLLVSATTAHSQQEEPLSFDALLQQHQAQLQNTAFEQQNLRPFEQMQQFQQVNQLSTLLSANVPPSLSAGVPGPSDMDLMSAPTDQEEGSLPTFVTDGVVESAVTGLPYVPLQQAVSQFMQHQQQIQQGQEQTQPQQEISRDLEAVSGETQRNVQVPAVFGPHKAVPKLQQWLAAMDPMAYSGPTFTNPVAKQVLKKLSDPALPAGERERLQRLVSSPYMFNMLGNPAFEDPQLWSGLVSGAAVPFPLRNTIMAQRTEIPFRIASTGDAMTDLDHVSVDQYSKLLQNSPSAALLGPNRPTHAARHRIFRIIQHLNQLHVTQSMSRVPTPHANLMHHTFEVVDAPPSPNKSDEEDKIDTSVKTDADDDDGGAIKDLFGEKEE